MRSIAYFLCSVLVALPTLHWLVVASLSLFKVHIPYNTLLSLLFSFGSLLPFTFSWAPPRPLTMVLGYAMMFLVLRRIWLFVVKKERTPVSFVGFQKALGYVGSFFFSLSVLTFILSMVLSAGSGVPAGLLMIPAMLCVPWAFFITEVTSFKRKITAHATV
jgi:hypothetical protein